MQAPVQRSSQGPLPALRACTGGEEHAAYGTSLGKKGSASLPHAPQRNMLEWHGSHHRHTASYCKEMDLCHNNTENWVLLTST